MATLTNHPDMWLADNAAASFERWESDHGVLNLSDAGRSDDEQRELIRRWNAGGKYNRPPYLYQPAWPSPHQSGLALDTPEHDRFGATCGAYGWRFNIPSDPVHAIYEEKNDQHINRANPLNLPKGMIDMGARAIRNDSTGEIRAYSDNVVGEPSNWVAVPPNPNLYDVLNKFYGIKLENSFPADFATIRAIATGK